MWLNTRITQIKDRSYTMASTSSTNADSRILFSFCRWNHLSDVDRDERQLTGCVICCGSTCIFLTWKKQLWTSAPQFSSCTEKIAVGSRRSEHNVEFQKGRSELHVSSSRSWSARVWGRFTSQGPHLEKHEQQIKERSPTDNSIISSLVLE